MLAPTFAARADIVVYADALGSNWQDWSWGGVTREFSASSEKHGGSASIQVTYTGGWSGLQLGNAAGVDISAYDALRFYLHGGSAGGQQIEVRVGNDTSYVSVAVSPTAGSWTQVDIPLLDLGNPRTATYVYWFNNSAGAQSSYYLDDVAFVNSGLPTPTPIPPGVGPALRVDASQDRHPIDPGIYGINFAAEDLAADLRLPVRRWGGNAVTRYNWQTDTSNRAFDWYFENIPNDNAHPELLPDGSSSDQFIEQDRRTGTATLLQVPAIGWVPKARAYACGFSVGKYGAQQSTDPWRPDCGNGVRTNGNEITGNDPLDTSIAVDPSFVQAWMNHLIGKYGDAANGGVRFYALDNEPMLWPDTHRDVHPQPTSYDEVRDRGYAYGAAIKAIDAQAKVLGPVVWGWTAYFWSALDWSAGGSWWNNPQDRLAHGNVPFLPWYLQQMHAYEQTHGVRLLDYLDIHYYPQASGVSLSPAGSSATQALRLRSTRSLWDPSYVDESWIGEAVRLVPRLRAWIDANYPGTKLAITEYNWGALDHINGALAQADVLGIFAREGVDLATLWDPPTTTMPAAFAFRMYRNYDGNDGEFGDTWVRAQSDDPQQLAIYAAQRSSDSALTLLVVNKNNNTLATTIDLSGFPAAASAELYRYSSANLAAIVRHADQTITGATLAVSLPAASLSLFVVPASGTGPSPTRTASATATPTYPTHTPTQTPTSTQPATATPSPILATCETTARTGCATALRGTLKLKQGEDPNRTSLAWKWSKGTVATEAFGNPLEATSYALCLYDDGALVLPLSVAPGGMCGSRPCWSHRAGAGFKYGNSAGNADGVSAIKLNAGSDKAAIVFKARGSQLSLPLPLTQSSAVTVQLVEPTGGCWESVFPAAASRNDTSLFSDRIP